MSEIEVELTAAELARVDAACRMLGVDRETLIRDAIRERLRGSAN